MATPFTGLARRSRAVVARAPIAATRFPTHTRTITITSTAASSEPAPDHQYPHPHPHVDPASPDARFEVVGSPFSLLSVSLAASQKLHTRRGTLVGLSGKSDNVLSTLSFLEPFRRAPVGIPFLYQQVSSTTPITALISTKASVTSIVTVHLDGRQDWIIAQRQALLAWTGQTLSLKPQYNVKLGLANWGNTYVTGRGLLALAANGQIYQVHIKAGESYVAHPSNVVAYTTSTNPPLPFRFKSSALHFQVPDLGFGSLLQNIKFFRIMSQTATWRAVATLSHTLNMWLRRSVWGDRLFLRFEGPTTILIQSRASRLSDSLTLTDVDEIANTPPGAVEDVVARKIKEEIKAIPQSPHTTPLASADSATPQVQFATIKQGKVEFDRSR
ncbi:hypothetical protein DM02DRAFT_618759 [Periconia macrospinosa]|uniref:Altered inheritance of mitochondria protein 24, mitochondrial n=1 Tax=Periconia macrospinosa TaxID=97972 RepID=A0A2V1D851_9PLEO|nr:hypothetical protein DM02DRAFT_618759 [Periconia macrospinosa]